MGAYSTDECLKMDCPNYGDNPDCDFSFELLSSVDRETMRRRVICGAVFKSLEDSEGFHQALLDIYKDKVPTVTDTTKES